MENVPEAQKGELSHAKQLLLVEQGHRMHNQIVETCFADCIKTFRSKTMDDGERGCVSKCAEKYLKLSKRAGYRFAEISFAEKK
mmetsp:Transcript_5834/g.13504  ORF Transcript_5834/g.13504 Transcript_5834/m.13504 type:complete len:84 (+) Transcript_5834:191-442(+)